MVKRLALLGVFVGSVLLSATGAMAAPATTYQYDALGRLITVSYPNGTTVTYTYDAAGNRTQVTSSSEAFVLPLLGGLVLPLQH